MTAPFDYFVIFAEMRTGSNFLEANLNAFGGIFLPRRGVQPAFHRLPEQDRHLGVTQAMRDADPHG